MANIVPEIWIGLSRYNISDTYTQLHKLNLSYAPKGWEVFERYIYFHHMPWLLAPFNHVWRFTRRIF